MPSAWIRWWLGGALHAARGVEHTALNALTARLDTRVTIPKTLAPVRADGNTITNGVYTVTAEKGAAGVQILLRGKPVFGAAGLHAITVDDPWGSWGCMEELPEAMNLSDVRHVWTVTQVEVLERGPERATLVRATRYANDVKTAADAEHRLPATDVGEHRFRFVLTPGGQELSRLAAELEMPPVTMTAAPHPGELPQTGSLASLASETFRLLAIKPAQDDRSWIVRVQETAGKSGCPVLVWLGYKVKLDTVEAHRIASWRLRQKGGQWQADRVLATER